MFKKIMTIAILTITASLLIAATSSDDLKKTFKKAKMKQCSGTLVLKDDVWYMATEDGQEPQLFIDLEDIEMYEDLKWEHGAEVSVAGLVYKQQFMITTIFTETDTIYIRDSKTDKYSDADKETKWEVIPKKCISGGICLKLCPVDAIEFVKGKAVIDKAKCINCGMCAHGGIRGRGCPTDAIIKK